MKTTKKYKFYVISELIEQDILAKRWNGRLPNLNELEEIYQANVRTIMKACKLLEERGLLVSHRNFGYVTVPLANVQENTGNVAICCDKYALSHVVESVLLRSLQTIISESGEHPVFMQTEDAIFDDFKFWHSMHVDGFIFVFGALTAELAMSLNLNNLKFISANRIPTEWDANYVDYNLEQGFALGLEHLLARGHRKIGFVATGAGQEWYYGLCLSIYRHLMQKYNCFDPELFFCSKSEKDKQGIGNAAIEYFLELSKRPTAIFSTSGTIGLRDSLRNRGIDPVKDIELVVSREVNNNKMPDISSVEFSEEELAREVWQRFKEIIANPEQQATGTLIDFKLRTIK
jgi:DNA-binding LacI/PurR family transcriptional regulator